MGPQAPRLEVDLHKVEHNTRVLVDRLNRRGIAVTGITKAALGNPMISAAMLRGGVAALGDSRPENLKRLAQTPCPTWLIRTPMISEAAQVVQVAGLSCNTELDVIDALSSAALAAGVAHKVLLMIELGDRREGIMPADVLGFIERMRRMPAIELQGIGVNLACASGVAPDNCNMRTLSELAQAIEVYFNVQLAIVSGGNSANLVWAANAVDVGRINNLRLGEAILLGREALHRQPVAGLHTNAFSLVCEVIEAGRKPVAAVGTIGQKSLPNASPGNLSGSAHADRNQAILAIGAQDVDPAGLVVPEGIAIVSASSDHLVLDTGARKLRVGDELTFGLDYSALLRAMTSPFVALVSSVSSGRHREPIALS